MGVFFVLLLVPMAIQHIGIKGYRIDYRKKNERALAFFFVFLTILVMFRHESVGNDTRTYILFFNRFTKSDWSSLGKEGIEIGYAYFNKIISLISEEPLFLFVATAVAVTAMLYPTYKRLCTDAALTIVLFCNMSTFVMMFSGIRQMLAIGIGVVAYELTRRKKVIPFLLAVCVAMTFHVSAFILFAMYPLYHAQITKKWLLAVVPAMAIVFLFNRPIFTVLTAIIEQYTRFEGGISETGAYMMLFLFAVFVIFSFVIPDESRMDQETIGLRNILLFVLALQMFAPLHALAMRMNYYFIIFIPLLLPKVIQCREVRWNQIAVAGRHIMVVFFLVYFFFNAFTSDASSNLHVFPYHFFWETV